MKHKKLLIISSVSVIAIASIVCGVLFAAKQNNNIAQGESTDNEQDQEKVLAETPQASPENNIEDNKDEQEPKKEEESKKSQTENKKQNSTQQKEQAKNNTTKQTNSIPTCNTRGAAIIPKSKECNTTMSARASRIIYLNELGIDDYTSGFTGSTSDKTVVSSQYHSILFPIRNGAFRIISIRPGKADIIVWREYQKERILTIHVTAIAEKQEEIMPTELNINCPDRNEMVENIGSWLSNNTISYAPSNTSFASNPTLSATPNQAIELRLDSVTSYSVRLLENFEDVPDPITITIKYGSVSGSCTF